MTSKLTAIDFRYFHGKECNSIGFSVKAEGSLGELNGCFVQLFNIGLLEHASQNEFGKTW